MDTEQLFPADPQDLDGIAVVEGSPEELTVITSYVEITRAFQEIYQLFNLFRYHLNRLRTTYDLNTGDTINRLTPITEPFSDQIELNALFISYISAGKTLIDAIQTCVCENGSAQTQESFRKFTSNLYDQSFSYRLLTRLRDFAQHGHLPISIHNYQMCFDFGQIAYTPHFHHNKALLAEMEEFNRELLTKHMLQPRYIFTLTTAEYTVAIGKLYHHFWKKMQEHFFAVEYRFQSFLHQNPTCTLHQRQELNGYLFYNCNDGTLHTFNTKENARTMVKRYIKEARRFYNDENAALERLHSTSEFKKLTPPEAKQH